MDFNQIILLTAQVIYYILAGFFLFFSLFTVYILLRYGKSRLVSGLIALSYTVFFLTLLILSFAALQNAVAASLGN
jgi:drug/metabolite transporter superfamily protein YnfA